MIDKNGKIMDPDSARPVVLNFDSKADKTAFDELKFVLQYEDFFDGRHLLLVPDPNHQKMWVAAHRCGGTVLRTVDNLDLGDIPLTRAGFYFFSGDDDTSQFPEVWKSNIKISLRCRIADARQLCEEDKSYESVPEWDFVLKHSHIGEKLNVRMIPCNKFDDGTSKVDIQYYAPIVFSSLVNDICKATDEEVFFNIGSLERFVELECSYGLLGPTGNILVSEYENDIGGRKMTERTFIFSMDRKSGFFDYDAFDKSK